MNPSAALTLASLIFAAAPATSQPVHAAHEDSVVKCARDNGNPDGLGCHILAERELSEPSSAAIFWQVDRFPTAAAAAKAAETNSVVVRAYDAFWLMTIGPKEWRPKGGERAASVGPLPVDADRTYTAQYMAAAFEPGMRTLPHVHPGPEAWVVLEGSQCLETPEGATVLSAGQSGIVRGGIPMMLFGVGETRRRSLVLILHDSKQAATIFGQAWAPKGLCK